MSDERLQTLIGNVVQWGRAKSLTDTNAQFVVMCEEMAELIGVIMEDGSKDEFVDAVGDTLVTLILLYDMHSQSVEDTIEGIERGFDVGMNSCVLGDAPAYHTVLMLYAMKSARFVRRGLASEVRERVVKTTAVLASTVKAHTPFDPVDCLEVAWETIRNRTGKIINGSFVKDSDLGGTT